MSAIKKVSILVVVAWFTLCTFSSPAYAQTKKIVFVSGPKDHGMVGRHEYDKDLKLLAYCLEHSSNLKGVTTQVYEGTRPTLAELQGVAAIVFEGSGDGVAKEHHPLFPQNTTTDGKTYDAEKMAYLKGLEGLMRKGLGLVVFHYATEVRNETAKSFYKEWLGGTYLSEPGVRNNPVDQWTVTFPNQSHPVMRGVKPWSYKEEIFSKFDPPEDPRRTILLLATPAGAAAAGPRIASWALQRQDGGRAFLMGGIDWYSNLLLEDHRRFLLNGVAWAGKIEVPAGGILSVVPEELTK